jgi:hypothetical protein
MALPLCITMIRRTTPMPVNIRSLAFVLAAMFGGLGGAHSEAACVQDVFCSDQYVFSKPLLHGLSCEELWVLRNSIFDERGYCFPRQREAARFDNKDCTIDAFSDLELNGNERDNVKTILAVELAKSCKR